MASLWWLLTLFSAIVMAARSNCKNKVDPANQFNFPDPSCIADNYVGIENYPLGRVLSLKWTTNVTDRLSLLLWQVNGTSVHVLFNVSETTRSYDFNGYPPQSLAKSNTFFFGLYSEGTRGPLFETDYFYYTDPNPVSSIVRATLISVSATRTGTAASTAIATVTPTESSIVTGTATSANNAVGAAVSTSVSSSSATPSANSSQLSGTAYIGIGVGVGLGIAILAGVLWFCFRRHRRSKIPPEASPRPMRPDSSFLHEKMAVKTEVVSAPSYDFYANIANSPSQYHSNPQYVPYRPAEMEHTREQYPQMPAPVITDHKSDVKLRDHPAFVNPVELASMPSPMPPPPPAKN